MENELFVPYRQSLDLEELGFDEPCIALYRGDKLLPVRQTSFYFFKTFCNKIFRNSKIDITAPLYQQAFRWFREKYNLHHTVLFENINGKYAYIYGKRIGGSMLGQTDSYEEAQLGCLKKLIEIVKNKNE